MLLMDPAASITGIGWGISVAGWLVSPKISELLDKCFSYIGFPSPYKVEQMQRKILQLKLMLEATTRGLSTEGKAGAMDEGAQDCFS